jgi:hypothetical protein
MIARELKEKIEAYAQHLHRDNRLLQLAREGKVTVDAIVPYLSGVLYMLRQTPGHLRQAARRAHELGRHDLAAYFERKSTEERNHDQWAVDDFRELGRLFGVAATQPPDAGMMALAELLDRTIEGHPPAYLAYILLVEYFTVLVGPAWLAALEDCCGIPRRALSAIDKHVELDRDHTTAGFHDAEALLTEADRPALDQMLAGAMAAWDGFYDRLYVRQLEAATRAAGRATA